MTKKVTKCIFSFSPESIRGCATQITELPPLPESINKRGVYVNNREGAAHQIIILYEFDGSKFAEAWKNISKQIGSLCGVPGLALSAHIVEKGWEDKAYRINQQSQGIFKPFCQKLQNI